MDGKRNIWFVSDGGDLFCVSCDCGQKDSTLAKFLSLDLGCDVQCLGIQIRSNEIGGTVSRQVLHAIDEIADGLDELLRELMTFEHQRLN